MLLIRPRTKPTRPNAQQCWGPRSFAQVSSTRTGILLSSPIAAGMSAHCGRQVSLVDIEKGLSSHLQYIDLGKQRNKLNQRILVMKFKLSSLSLFGACKSPGLAASQRWRLDSSCIWIFKVCFLCSSNNWIESSDNFSVGFHRAKNNCVPLQLLDSSWHNYRKQLDKL